MAHHINEEDCISCGACEPVCPVTCISVTDDDKRRIDAEACIDCGACAEVCPVGCIDAE
ncbi:4Fe-4S binding protein [Desulfuromonas acetoxidans]|nr:4Fe-4S binding protein [Desulfuromonas acetoxidans]MBF0644576.1 4Fe-4S binding protein [Desulfuromonas acetoxidans]NVD23897.1 4Fe-4S binding protein [Desulfuromonas acetoxidans]NVE16194.1 4Fe-4S binding protein [Desulfuromonas acetoxidans]